MRGQPRNFAALLVQVVDGPERALDNLIERLQPLRDALLAHLQQLVLGHVQHFESRLALVGRTRNRRRTDRHQLPQQALVLDDPDVVFNDRPQRQTLGQRRQVSHAAHRLDLLVARQLVRQRHNVHGALRVHQIAHAQEDALMRIKREIARVQLLSRLRVRCVIQQNRAQNGLFGVDVRRQPGVKSQVRDRSHTLRV